MGDAANKPVVKACPWAAMPSNDSTSSLSDVMSEQLASTLEEEENSKLQKNSAMASLSGPVGGEFDGHFPLEDSTGDDLMIAQMLQMQFDKEYDTAVGLEESQRNGGSKVRVSLEKYKVVPDNPVWEDSDDEDDELAAYLDMDERKRHWDWYEKADKETGQLPKCGYKQVGDKIITKHDKEISQRANGRRIMEFPPGIETGDGGGLDMQLPNAVYNKIRNFSIREGKRKARLVDKVDKSTAEQAIDPKTRVLLFKMVNGGILDSIHGVISTGKEAVILLGDGGPGPEDCDEPLNVPKECAIKVFKTTLNEFKNRDKYIKDDYRFRDRFSKQNPRKVIHMWAEKELHNLMKMSKHGIRVPEVVMLKKHVLVMSFIGHDGTPAPKIRDATLSQSDAEAAYADVLQTMKTLYNECHLVHADLSEYNILWHDKECWYIDVSQAVEPNHPHGLEFLLRDCRNVSDFFGRRIDVKSPEELFTEITELPLEAGADEAEVLSQVRDYERNQEILSGVDGAESEKVYPFDYCWEQSQQKGANALEKSQSRPIPGHAKAKSGKSSRSPKSGSFQKSPSASSLSKSPKSPKSPGSGPNLASLTNDELKNLKDSLVMEQEEKDKKATTVKFELDRE